MARLQTGRRRSGSSSPPPLPPHEADFPLIAECSARLQNQREVFKKAQLLRAPRAATHFLFTLCIKALVPLGLSCGHGPGPFKGRFQSDSGPSGFMWEL